MGNTQWACVQCEQVSDFKPFRVVKREEAKEGQAGFSVILNHRRESLLALTDDENIEERELKEYNWKKGRRPYCQNGEIFMQDGIGKKNGEDNFRRIGELRRRRSNLGFTTS